METVIRLGLEVVKIDHSVIHNSLTTARVFLHTNLGCSQVFLYLLQMFILQVSSGLP